jgi:tetratricopeptide (TPR) repeat protein
MRALLLLWVIAVAGAAPRREAEPEDRVALAGLLVRDGDWERAAEVLAEVDLSQRGLDVTRYWTLRGLVALHDKRAADAASAFQQALASAAEGEELLEMHLARAQLAAQQPALAIEALDRTGETGAALPGTWLLRAEAHVALEQYDQAWQALESGAARFPDQPDLRRQQVFLLVRLGLYREARERGEALLARADTDGDDAIAIAEALRRGGETAEALTILEAALLERGDDRDLLVQAARTSLDADQPRNAGRFLERAAVLEPALALEAAEAYRRGGDLEAALRVNGQLLDPVAKARQRLGLLLEGEAWDRAVALEDRLERVGLAQDDGVAYGLAYAWFRLGDLERAERWLKGIDDPEAFRRATELRQAMAGCDPTWGCF